MQIVDLLLMAAEILSPVLVAALAWAAAKAATLIRSKVANLWCDFGYGELAS